MRSPSGSQLFSTAFPAGEAPAARGGPDRPSRPPPQQRRPRPAGSASGPGQLGPAAHRELCPGAAGQPGELPRAPAAPQPPPPVTPCPPSHRRGGTGRGAAQCPAVEAQVPHGRPTLFSCHRHHSEGREEPTTSSCQGTTLSQFPTLLQLLKSFQLPACYPESESLLKTRI